MFKAKGTRLVLTTYTVLIIQGIRVWRFGILPVEWPLALPMSSPVFECHFSKFPRSETEVGMETHLVLWPKGNTAIAGKKQKN